MFKPVSFRTIIIISLFFVSSVSLSFASIFAPNCICEIEAVVIDTKEWPVAKDEFQTEDLTYVGLEIVIAKTGKMVRPGYTPDLTCAQYKPDDKIKLTVIKERAFKEKNVIIKPGSIITGEIEATGDERGAGYFFDNIEVEK